MVLSDEEFDAVICETFETIISDGTTVELCSGGKFKSVTKANLDEYVDLVVKVRLSEAEKQLGWVMDAFQTCISFDVFALFTPLEFEERICGTKEITVDMLKAIDESSKSNSTVKMFFEVFERFTVEQRRKYLRFAWGRSKIPSITHNLRYYHRINYGTGSNNGFPVAHTCFFKVDTPYYDNVDIMFQRFAYAIEACGEIDDDAYMIGRDDNRE